MEAILPFKIKNERKYFQCALKLGLDEMQMYKFIYVMQQSDLDMFPKMHDERINVLIYCWELCEDYKQKLNPDEWELPEEMETILKLLVPWSLDIWFSKEWDKCKSYLRLGLIHCLNRARDLLMRVPDMMQINWDFLLLYNLTPWNVTYLRNLTVTKEKTLETGAQSIETKEEPATYEDVSYVKLEPLPLIVLRLIKLFDQCSIDMVKTLCMRVIAAWNGMYQKELERSRYIPPEDKRCLLLICHIYLMAVYESDDVKGYVIDNMINNIRFYCQGLQTSHTLYAMENLEYTPARFIALTNIRLRLRKEEFFDFFIWNSYDTSLVNLFGVVSQAYKSYLLGNLLMELNNMNEDDFASNVPLYKRLMNSYVNEREKSELFMLNELDKLENQRYAHNVILTVKNMTDFKSKICKGNRMSNIGNYENSDDNNDPTAEKSIEIKKPAINEAEAGDGSEKGTNEKESDLRLDPIFQNIPNNENILYYVYEVLSKKDYKGWHFAKIVLLVKIIGHELNMIETWRYHPGLTIDFMLNLETKLSKHYADLAKIFSEHAFIEQEFWLTAFYLNPTADGYQTIIRLGMRNNRKRTDENTKLVMSIDNIDAKYGLLSSTIDVKEIAHLENTEELDGDYDPLFNALKSLHLPDSLIKDMLTTIFLPRNRSFAWVVDWTELRTRCKILLNNAKEKKRFVELNMAEANERLKFLNIDYEKYKNRPQLDYGTIEQGYENLMNSGDYDVSDEEEEDEDFEDDEDVYESQRGGRGGRGAETKKEEEKIEEDNSQEEDPYLTGKRRTRARVAATMATFLFQDIPRATRRRRNKDNELVPKDDEFKIKISEDKSKSDKEDLAKDTDDKSNDSKSPITTSESLVTSPITVTNDDKDIEDTDIIKKNIKVCLNERPSFSNSTPDFQPLIDIWNVEKSDIQSIDNNCVSLLESSTVLQRMLKLKLLNKEINPQGCNEHEAIDEKEMLIINTDYPMTTRFSTPESETKHVKVSSTQNIAKMDEKVVTLTLVEESSNNRDTELNAEMVAPSIPQESSQDTDAKDVTEDVEIVAPSVPEESSKDKDSKDITEEGSSDVMEVKPIDDAAVPIESIIDFGDIIEEVEEFDIMEVEPIDDASVPNESFTDFEDIIEEIEEYDVMEVEAIDDASVPIESITDSKDVVEDKEEFAVMEVEPIDDASIPNESDKVPDKISDDVSKIKQQFSTDNTDNINESIQSDMSTTALKDSEEISVSNCENNDSYKMEDKNEKHQNTENINEISKEKEITETEQEKNEEQKKEDDKMNENSLEENKKDDENNEEQKKVDENKEDQKKEDHKDDENKEHIKEDDKSSKGDDKDDENKEDDKMDETEISSLEHKESDIEREIIEEPNKSHAEINKIEEKDSETQNDANKSDTERKDSDDKNDELTTITEETTEQIQGSIDKDSELIEINDESKNTEKLNPDDTNVTRDTQNIDSEIIVIENKDSEQTAVNEKSENIEKSSQETDNTTKYKDSERTVIDDEPENVEQKCQDTKNTSVTKEEKPEADEKDKMDEKTETNEKAETHEEAETHEKTEIDKKTEKDKKAETDEKTEIDEKAKTDEKTKTDEKAETDEKTEKDERSKTDEKSETNEKAETNEKTETDEKAETDEKIERDESKSDLKNNTEEPSTALSLLEDISMDSLRFDDESEEENKKNIKQICFKKVKVLIRRLTAADVANLRQPKIRIKRIDMEKFKPIQKHSTKKVYLDIDDSSNHSSIANSSSSDAYRPPKTKANKLPPPRRRHCLRQARTSESENDSNNSEDVKLMKISSPRFIRDRRLSTPISSTQLQNNSSSSTSTIRSARHTSALQSNLIVTPRSASGLKLRISNVDHPPDQPPLRKKRKPSKPIVMDDIIQLSSSSSEVGGGGANTLDPIDEVIDIDDLPLFEEEMVI